MDNILFMGKTPKRPLCGEACSEFENQCPCYDCPLKLEGCMTYFAYNDCTMYDKKDTLLLIFPTDNLSLTKYSNPQIWAWFYHHNHIIGLNRLGGKTETARKIETWKSLSKLENMPDYLGPTFFMPDYPTPKQREINSWVSRYCMRCKHHEVTFQEHLYCHIKQRRILPEMIRMISHSICSNYEESKKSQIVRR